jgi:hypothetical protein
VKRTCGAIAVQGAVAGLFCVLLLCAPSQSGFAQSAVTVWDNGDPANRVDIAILGDGYTSGEMGKYAEDVRKVLSGIFAQEPFAEYQRYFNVHRIDVVSSESGADHPESSPPVYKNTAFDSAFNCSGIQRLICANNSKVLTVASSVLSPAERDFLLVIVNDPTYGGSGGFVAVASTHPDVVELVLHEEAHSFGLLGDEYSGPPPPACNAAVEPPEANVTMQTQRNLIKWALWIDPATPVPTFNSNFGIPGLFQGAQYCDTEKYRPTYASKMRFLNYPFEQVNTEQLLKRVYNWVSPLDSSTPSSPNVTVSRGQTQLFSVTTPVPLTHDLSVSWFVDSQIKGSGPQFSLNSSALSAGIHTVEAKVEDVTGMVRSDPASILSELRSWNVTITEPSGLAMNVSAGGAAAAITAGGDGEIHTGYAVMDVNSGAAPYGTAVFSFKQNAVTVSEAGVPPSPPTTSARIFIEYRSGVNALPGRGEAGIVDVNTGIVVVNRNPTDANVVYTLRDVEGNIIAPGHGTVPKAGHMACFIDELKRVGASDFNLPPDFQNTVQFASLEISSDQPVSVLALRGTTNQRGEFLITTTPVADLTKAPGTNGLYFPHFVDGGGYTTSVILLNTSDSTESGTLEILNSNGARLTVTRAGGTANFSFPYSIKPGGLFHFQTDGFPENIADGWVRLIPDNSNLSPVGSGVFSFILDRTLISESGIPAANSTTHARIYVDLSGSHNTGLAFANLANTEASITISAFQKDGVTAIGTSRGPVSVDANGHKAAFADEFMEGLPDGFTGVFDIRSNSPFAALTLRSLYNENNDFLMTTFPIADVNRSAPVPIVFPHIADGGGYTTQVILISTAEASNTTLHFYNENGVALDLAK